MLTIAKLHSESVAYYESTVDPEKAVAASGSEAAAGDTPAGPDGYYSEDGTAPATAWINGVDATQSVALAKFLGVRSGEQLDGAAVRGWFNRMRAPSGAKLGRKPGPTTLPGYDLTFCAPKSVSVLWGLTDSPAVRVAVDAAHAAAVSAAMEYITEHAAYTRRRVDEDTVLVERTRGLSGVKYEHRTARSGDPHVHSHVLLSNRQLCADGKVLSLDGVNVYHEARAGGMIYQATLRAELSAALGVEWGQTVNGCADILGLDDPEMLDAFSTRTRELDQWRDANGFTAAGDIADDAEEAAASAALTRIAQKKTRQTKDLQTSLAEHEQQWQVQLRGIPQASEVREFIDRLNPTGTGTLAEPDDAPAVTGGGYPSVDEVLAAVSAERSTFTRADLVEAAAALVGPGVAADQIRATVEQVVDEAIASTSAWSVTPDQARSFDRSKREGSQRFTTSVVVAEVDRGIDLATATATARQISVDQARSMIHPVPGELSVQQADAMVSVVTSRSRASVVVAPAGSGKTSSLKAAHAVWSAAGCQVVGLAPTGKAADVMTGEDVADESSTIARVFRRVDGLDPVAAAGVLGWDQDTVVVVDEAGMVATPDVVRLLEVATAADARVVLVGDPHQYSAVKARSGMLATLAHELPDAVELSEVFRQQDPAERAASRGLRDGDGPAVARAADWYAEHGRLSAGSVSAMLTDALEAWHADVRAGWESLLVADSNDTVDALNVAAQQRMAADGVIDPTGTCVPVGSKSAYVGDVVLTRRNDYSLVSSAGEPVRNGQRWKITAIGTDGSAQLCRLDGVGGDADAAVTVTVPAEYLDRHTRLGYASTGHAAQGVTVDAARVVAEATRVDRAGVYVPLTRGRKVNALYLAETSPGDSETGHDRAATVDAAGAAGSRGRRESVEYARDLLVAACSRERADVTPHAVWGKNWDRWSMERMSTDLAVDVHPFAGTPMAEAMEYRRQLRESRLDAYAARQAAAAGVAGPEAPAEVPEDAPVKKEKPQAQPPSPRPDAQRPLREVDGHLLRLAGESWGLRLKVKQAREPLEQEATALRQVEQATGKLTAAQEQADRCAELLRTAEEKFRDAEQAAGSGIGWLKGAGRKKAERNDLHAAQQKVAQARGQTAVAQQGVERAARWLTVVQHQAEPVQLTPQQRQACQEQLALYRRLEDVDEVRRELLDREREQAQAVAAAAVGQDLPAAEDIEVVFAEYTDPSGSATGSVFGYSITEQLRASKASQPRSSSPGQSSGPSSAPGTDRDVDGPSL
ncbi:MobF family relaxase [Corynebacterium variabile]|uniref:MobF family relaxase n=1 Tax=Corynebacterium variabile TaxID=1727 RepID=UPI00289C5D97|nr:MobF family relaxase [Corynebacterium variabile]